MPADVARAGQIVTHPLWKSECCVAKVITNVFLGRSYKLLTSISIIQTGDFQKGFEIPLQVVHAFQALLKNTLVAYNLIKGMKQKQTYLDGEWQLKIIQKLSVCFRVCVVRFFRTNASAENSVNGVDFNLSVYQVSRRNVD